jgi:hypothetical protein
MKRLRSALATCCVLLTTFGVPAIAGSPDRSFEARFGGFFLEGDGDFWADNESVFTLDASDFDDATIGLTYSVSFNRFFDMDINADLFDETIVSEYRDFTDDSGFPIFHDSTLSIVPVTLGLRFLPFGHGRHGERRPTLFLGAGAGVNFWRYEEFGDFIDFNDPANPLVFGDFSESGQAFVSYVAAGLQLPVSHNFSLGFEARRFMSDDELKGDFAGLGTLDMNGTSASISGHWRF